MVHNYNSKIKINRFSQTFSTIWTTENDDRYIGFCYNLCGGTSGTAATAGLLYQPRMIGEGDCGEIGGMKIGRGNRSTRRNLLQRHFVHHKSHMTRPGSEPGPPRWEASD
jgi:hypothetical protein